MAHPLSCPRCSQPLGDSGKHRFACPNDCGVFFRSTAVRKLIESMRTGEVVADDPALAPQKHAGRGPYRRAPERALNRPMAEVEAAVFYLKCPDCDKTMNRTQLITGSRVVVDACIEHGVWFDKGEIQLAAQYARSKAQTAEHSQRLAYGADEHGTVKLASELLDSFFEPY